MDKCEISQSKCAELSYLIEAAQRSINNADEMLMMINKLPDHPGKDIFIRELDMAKNRDGKRLLDAIDILQNCGCKDIGVAVLFA